MINVIILGLSAWAGANSGVQLSSDFTLGVTTIAISSVSMGIAIISYTLIPEKMYRLRVATALIAYILLLGAVGVLNIQPHASAAPFLALWMITAIFSGTFGIWVVGLLILVITGYAGFVGVEEQLNGDFIVGITLAGYLPLLVSFVLWHSKSNNERTKERAYYDLANELDQIANKSDLVISAISDGVIAINNQGTIELINPAATRLAGWGHQDALNLSYKSVLQLLTKKGEEMDKSNDPVFQVLTTNQTVRRSDLQLQTSSGKKRSIELIISPIGHIGSGAIIVFRDITKEQAEENAQAEFISTASHEMRTPVASIEGYLGLALNPSTAKIDDKARQFITKAHESAQHLGRLFQDLLDVTKADDGRLSNNPKVIDLVQFTENIIDGLKPKADEKQLRLFFKPVARITDGGLKNLEPVYYVNLDADHLREVLGNLVENAIKYTRQGEVIINVEGDDTHAVVSIADSGIGIPSEDIPHLFQKFYRVDNTDTREIGGTGLGLYLCRRLVESMEGRIWVESEYKKGSTFFVELPRIPHEEAQRLLQASEVKAAEAATQAQPVENTSSQAEKHRQEALATPIIMNKKNTIHSLSTSPTQATPPSTPQQTKPPQPQPSGTVQTPQQQPSAAAAPSGSPAPPPVTARPTSPPSLAVPPRNTPPQRSPLAAPSQPTAAPTLQPIKTPISVRPTQQQSPGPVHTNNPQPQPTPTTPVSPQPQQIINSSPAPQQKT